MTTSLAISAGAAASANAANMRARKAEEASCKMMVKGYEHNTATIAEQKDYAHCINLLHPKALDPSAILILKILFIIGLIGAVVTYMKEEYSDFIERVFISLLGFIVAPLAVACIGVLFYGIYWVLFL